MKNLKKYMGCLIGGAAGDALGYSIEFYQISEIKYRYGENGITNYDLVNGVAQISDDTQMSMFTANGLLNAKANNYDYLDSIDQSYIAWLETQNYVSRRKHQNKNFWLMNVPELYALRAPGNTCISAIMEGAKGTISNPVNNSKGCGGIMRVAPIGLFFTEDEMPANKIAYLGAQAAALTHGHDLGFIPSYFLVYLVNLLSHNDDIDLEESVKKALYSTINEFSDSKYIEYFEKLINRAIELSKNQIDDLKAFEELGEGWVAEETAAVAVYCALKYRDNFDLALRASVNHNGDSDSTGAVTGNILGSYIGIDKIPQKYIDDLEHKNILLELARDLYSIDLNDESIKDKYIKFDYKPDYLK